MANDGRDVAVTPSRSISGVFNQIIAAMK